MPDMSVPGAHLESLVEELEYKVEACRSEATKQTVLADTYHEVAIKLKRALREEAQKQPFKPTEQQ